MPHHGMDWRHVCLRLRSLVWGLLQWGHEPLRLLQFWRLHFMRKRLRKRARWVGVGERDPVSLLWGDLHQLFWGCGLGGVSNVPPQHL